MNPARLALSSFAVLALLSCAPGEDDEARAPGPPIGFELALSQELETGDGTAELPLDFTNEHSAVIDLTPAQLTERLAMGQIMLIDVRTQEEVAEGMIPGAEHIPLADFAPGPALLERAGGREIILYCRSGRRSAIAGRNLSGFLGQPVAHLGGGIIEWKAANLEIIRP